MTPDTPVSLPRVLAIMLAGVAGSAGYMVVPLVVAALRLAGTPELLVGAVGSTDPAGMFVGATIALSRVARAAPRRAAMIALAASLVGNVGSLVAPPIAALIALRLLSGAGGGIVLALALSALGRTAQPDRNFALLTLAQMVFGMVAASVDAAGAAGLAAIYRTLFATQILGLAACIAFSDRVAPAIGEPAAAGRAARDPRLIWLTVAGNVLSAGGFLVLWANAEALTRRNGLGVGATVLLIDVGLAGGFAGTMFNAIVDGRNRRTLFATLFFVLGLAGTVPLGLRFGWAAVFPAAFLFQLGPAAVCYGFGAISAADTSGRLPIVFILAVKAGFAIAPLAGSALIGVFGLDAVAPASFVATVGAMLCYRLQIARAEAIVRERDAIPG